MANNIKILCITLILFLFSSCKAVNLVGEMYCNTPPWATQYKEQWNYYVGQSKASAMTNEAVNAALKIAQESAKTHLENQIAARTESMINDYTKSLSFINQNMKKSLAQQVSARAIEFTENNIDYLADSGNPGCMIYSLAYLNEDKLRKTLQSVVMANFKDNKLASVLYKQTEDKLMSSLKKEFPDTIKPSKSY